MQMETKSKGEVSEPKNKTEMKEIKDYLHLYLGQKVIHEKYPDTLMTIFAVDTSGQVLMGKTDEFQQLKPHHKLVLRPLSDMTEEEAIELATIHKYDIPEDDGVREELINVYSDDGELHLGRPYLPISMYKEGLLWLLKNGFDLFNLIPEGLAISKTQTQEQ